MTPKQQRVLDAISSLTLELKYAPTVREIMARVGVDSTSTIAVHLHALRRKGVIRWEPGKPRTIVVVSR